MDEDWDVEYYRSDFESQEHWELRKNFMLAHKDKFSEDEVVCLAQVFTNIELLGCRYPEETMRKVSALGKGLVESFREKKKNNLKRTFVAASDAANAKVKGQKYSQFEESKEAYCSRTVNFDARNTDKVAKIPYNNYKKLHVKKGRKKRKKRNINCGNLAAITKSSDSVEIPRLSGPFSDFVLFVCNDNPVNLLNKNASMNKCSISWNVTSGQNLLKACSVYLGNQLVATAEGNNTKSSKEAAAEEAIKKLKDLCYTVKIKAPFTSDYTVDAAALGMRSVSNKETMKPNIGEQIMRLMGWKGGGLGVMQQGMSEPIGVRIIESSNFHRRGLGRNTGDLGKCDFRKKAKSYIKTWARQNVDEDLVFSSTFTVEERKFLHEIALSLGLKSRSYGKKDKRHLVISKKTSPWRIVEELSRNGRVSSKYELLIPKSQ